MGNPWRLLFFLGETSQPHFWSRVALGWRGWGGGEEEGGGSSSPTALSPAGPGSLEHPQVDVAPLRPDLFPPLPLGVGGR